MAICATVQSNNSTTANVTVHRYGVGPGQHIASPCLQEVVDDLDVTAHGRPVQRRVVANVQRVDLRAVLPKPGNATINVNALSITRLRHSSA